MSVKEAAHQSQTTLFYSDSQSFFNIERLQEAARKEVAHSDLIQGCARGNIEAARALLLGFYAFTADFQEAIDSRANSAGLPRQPLYNKFGKPEARRALLNSALAVRQLARDELDGLFDKGEQELRGMQTEELH